MLKHQTFEVLCEMRNDADNGVDELVTTELMTSNSPNQTKAAISFAKFAWCTSGKCMIVCLSIFFGNLQHYFSTRKETKTSTRILLRSAMIKFLVQGCLVLNNFCFIKHKAAKLHLFFNDDKHFVDRYDS